MDIGNSEQVRDIYELDILVYALPFVGEMSDSSGDTDDKLMIGIKAYANIDDLVLTDIESYPADDFSEMDSIVWAIRQCLNRLADHASVNVVCDNKIIQTQLPGLSDGLNLLLKATGKPISYKIARKIEQRVQENNQLFGLNDCFCWASSELADFIYEVYNDVHPTELDIGIAILTDENHDLFYQYDQLKKEVKTFAVLQVISDSVQDID